MMNTADFLDALRVKLVLPSDGRLAAYLGMHRQHVSRYRTLEGTFDDAMSLRVADILGIDAAYVVACMHYQRAKPDAERKLWEKIAAQCGAMYIMSNDMHHRTRRIVDRRHHNLISATLANIVERRHLCEPDHHEDRQHEAAHV